MTDRPIIFSGPMVRALLDGRKTQTRRLVRKMPPAPSDDSLVHPPKHDHAYFDAYCGGKRTPANPRGMTQNWCWWTRDDRAGHGCRIGYVPGDRLWVRENFRVSPDACEGWDPSQEPCAGWLDYAAGGHAETDAPDFAAVLKVLPKDVDWDCLPDNWRPSIHMPRWASRLTLIVEDVRVEPLQAISEADAVAEGIEFVTETTSGRFYRNYGGSKCPLLPWGSYRSLWESLHGADSWEANPHVVAITFRVERGNIDRIAA